ncbi:L-threonine 3-dehydrogenase [Parenemella sanctibonifatiensis]|uniref:L-threonine 3-dehydrogenase n=1 Tax=Parenemella sanctibonifatiensis TaxID=2016505 RepID=UPI001E4EC6DD|nr:L-threonine 3-dehydrogenase [Parenemella sanctibonifatiensis]
MKALPLGSTAAPEPGLTYIKAPTPTPGPTDVLIKVWRTGICGTDLHIEAWDDWARGAVSTTPVVVGHEFSGEIVAVGSAVTDLSPGQFVSGEGHLVCGQCRNCRAGNRHLCQRTKGIGVQIDGCFADHLVLPATNVWVHKQPIDPDVAAIFDPFGNAVHTALAFPCLGEDVLVSGAGPIGIMAALVAKHAGARHVAITDLSPERLALAERLGVSKAIDVRTTSLAQAQQELEMSEGFDVGLEMSGAGSALRAMIDNMRHGGRIAMLGIPAEEISLDWSTVVFRMLTIKGIYGREIFETWYAMAVLLQSGLDISGIITDRFPADEWEAAFQTARAGAAGKVVLDWT